MATTTTTVETDETTDQDRDRQAGADEMSPEELKAALERLTAEQKRTADALKKANKESEQTRLRLKDYEKDEQRKREAELPELERVKAERDAAIEEKKAADRERDSLVEQKLDVLIDSKIMQAAFPLMDNPELAPRLIERKRITVEDDGTIAGVKDAVDRLLKDYPSLAKSKPGGGSPAAMALRRNGQGGDYRPAQNPNVNPYEQSLHELGRGGGRM